MDQSGKKNIGLTIDPIALAKIMFWVRKANEKEVSGFGKVKLLPSGGAHILDVYLLEQENTNASTEIDATSLSRLMFQTKDIEGDLKFWWHSHGHGGTFFSGTDRDTIKMLGKQGWIIASCFNTLGDVTTAIFSPDPMPILTEDVLLTSFLRTEEILNWSQEFKEKVKLVEFSKPQLWIEENAKPLTKKEKKLLRKQMRENESLPNGEIKRWQPSQN